MKPFYILVVAVSLLAGCEFSQKLHEPGPDGTTPAEEYQSAADAVAEYVPFPFNIIVSGAAGIALAVTGIIARASKPEDDPSTIETSGSPTS